MAVGDLRDMVLWEDGRLLEIGKDADWYREQGGWAFSSTSDDTTTSLVIELRRAGLVKHAPSRNTAVGQVAQLVPGYDTHPQFVEYLWLKT